MALRKKTSYYAPTFTSGVNCFTNESKENRDRKGPLVTFLIT